MIGYLEEEDGQYFLRVRRNNRFKFLLNKVQENWGRLLFPVWGPHVTLGKPPLSMKKKITFRVNPRPVLMGDSIVLEVLPDITNNQTFCQPKQRYHLTLGRVVDAKLSSPIMSYRSRLAKKASSN